MYLRMFYKVNNVYDGSKQGKGLHISVYAFSNEDVDSWSK